MCGSDKSYRRHHFDGTDDSRVYDAYLTQTIVLDPDLKQSLFLIVLDFLSKDVQHC